jgi:hypothetical protein
VYLLNAVRFQVLMVRSVKVAVLLDDALRSLVEAGGGSKHL